MLQTLENLKQIPAWMPNGIPRKENVNSGLCELTHPLMQMYPSIAPADIQKGIYNFPGRTITMPGLTFLCLQQCTYKINVLNQIDFNTEFQVFIVTGRSTHRSITQKRFTTGTLHFLRCDILPWCLYGFGIASSGLSSKIQQ